MFSGKVKKKDFKSYTCSNPICNGADRKLFCLYRHKRFPSYLFPSSNSDVLQQVLVFDFGSEVYVWHGKDVPLGDRKVAVKLGKQLYSSSYDYSNCRVNPLDASCTNTDVPQ